MALEPPPETCRHRPRARWADAVTAIDPKTTIIPAMNTFRRNMVHPFFQ